VEDYIIGRLSEGSGEAADQENWEALKETHTISFHHRTLSLSREVEREVASVASTFFAFGVMGCSLAMLHGGEFSIY
jgi:hypothetical protein